MRQYFARARVALTVPVVVAGLALSTGIASAATNSHASARPAVTGVTWNKIKPINQWHSAEARYGTGDPAWATRNGMVYLAGSLHRTGGSLAEFGVLPAAARPGHTLWITVYTLNDTTGTLVIYPNGVMVVSSTPAKNAPGYTSLAAVSYPARTTKQASLPLLNGWHSEQSQWNSGNPAYSVSGGVVRLSGSLATAGAATQFAVLPPAARPSRVLYLTVYTYAGTFGTVQIDPDGTAFAYDGRAASFTSLAGLSYRAASVRPHKLTLLNGWHSEQSQWNSGAPAYSVSNGVVYLSGSLATAGSNEMFARLPLGARPAHYLYIKVYTYGSSVGTVYITPSGKMLAYGPGTNLATTFTSLAGLSFPLGS